MKPTAPVRQRSLRDHNLGLALRTVAGATQPLSRARLADLTGVTRATASALVQELLDGGFLQEVQLPPTERSGRPATGIDLADDGLVGLGLEINVDYLSAAVVDLRGELLLSEVVAADHAGSDPVLVVRSLKKLAAKLTRQASARGRRVAGTALALPGLLRDGRLLVAPNLGWRDVDVQRLLGPEVALDNEANFAALAQVTPLRRSFVHVSGEIGVGAGIVLDGQLFRGARGWSGELGHVTVVADGPRCHCGARGCLEVYAGQPALDEGDLDAAGRALGIALSDALNVLDIGTVVLGGAYAERVDQLRPALEEELAARVLWARFEPPRVEVSDSGRSAAVLGAARSVVGTLLSEPERWLVT